MYKLLRQACCGQVAKSYGRSFLVIFRIVVDDVKNPVLVLMLRSRREDSDYVVRFDMRPLSVWC
jgi:hypothetical protein